ncbi:MAG: adenylate/guanylate cyclase domain-containing protein [Verrucomicrobiae bacterium]|nr:adenylate/guanylate cyclase domain-containing protein [Verrucomicrobiae bacterium]
MDQFLNLLDRMNSLSGSERKRIEEEIWTIYGVEKTVLILDMSGFSSTTFAHGIVHYLGMVRRMALSTRPIVARHNGFPIKFEADNLYAVFDESLDAVHAAVAINQAFHAANLATPDSLDIHVGIGIDCGKILIIPGKEFFGHAVNVASKLGEDLAAAGEILITARVEEAIRDRIRLPREALHFDISGLSLEAYRVDYPRE